VLRASERLLALINDLLDLQRVDDGRLALQLKPLSVRTVVAATFALLQPLAHQHDVSLRNEVDASAWVTADAQRLRQVLLNIVSNAIKYNSAGGSVRIAVLPDGSPRCALAVDDTGSGLTPAQLARLFQPFERLGLESSAIEGSGLGLLIARRLVDEMGGQLTLGGLPAGGTRVTLTLPTAKATSAAGPIDVALPAAAPLAEAALTIDGRSVPAPGSLRMLYVEDNRINAILFEEALRLRGGIDLQVAEDGAEALAMVAQWHPEILVLDANLPDMSGYDVLARLRELPALADVPAFMCSADAMAEDVQRAAAAGFVGYWTKPIDIARVMGDLDRLQLRP
jgi:CheY-like chemotaxis protein/anti-sigma regulatory factor (Ser/Thr protein kinase)